MDCTQQFLEICWIYENTYKELLLDSYPYGIERNLLEDINLNKADRKVYMITGIRRCGKSTLLKQITKGMDYIYLDFTDERLLELKPNEYNLILEASYYLG